MQELKVQNALLLQLINSKNRQNQLLFQQYDQLAADNLTLQNELDSQRNLNRELKRSSFSSSRSQPHSPAPAEPTLKLETELAELKRRAALDSQTITQVKVELEQKGGLVLLLQSQIQSLKLAKEDLAKERELLSGKGDRVGELQAALQLKEQAQQELTEYMNEQAERISALTAEGIATIDNYEAKLTARDEQIQQIQQDRQAQLQQQAQVEAQESGQERIKELEMILVSKEQAMNELSEFLQLQVEKVTQLEAKVEQTKIEEQFQLFRTEIEEQKQAVASKEENIVKLSEFLNDLISKNKDFEEKINQLSQQQGSNQEVIREVADQGEWQAEIDGLKLAIEERDLKEQSLLQTINELQAKLTQFEAFSTQLEEVRLQLHSKQAEVEELTVKVEQKNQSLEDFTTFIGSQTDRIKELEQKLEQTSQQAVQSDHQEGTGKSQQEWQQMVSDLEETIQSKSATIAELSEFMNEQAEKVIQLEQQLAKHENTPQTGENNHKATNEDRIEQLENKLKAKEQYISELNQFLEDQFTKVAELKEQVAQWEGKPDTEAERIKLIDQLQQWQTVADSRKNDNERLYQQIASHDHIHQLTKSALADKEQQVVTLQTTLAQKEQEYSQSTLQQNQLIQELEQQIISDKQQYQNQLEEQKTLLQSKPQQVIEINTSQEQKLRDTIAELEDTLNSKTNTIGELSEFMNEQAEKIAELEEKLQSSPKEEPNNNQHEELQAIINSKEQSLADLNQFLEEQITKNATLQDELTKAKEDFDAATAQHSTDKENNEKLIKQITAQKEALLQQTEELTANLKERQLKIQQLTETLQEKDELIGQVQSVENELAQSRTALSTKEDEVAHLRDLIATRENELEEMAVQCNQLQQIIKELDQKVSQQTGNNVQSSVVAELRQNIVELEETINSKSSTIAQLSQFMNEQAEQIIELEEKLANLQNDAQTNDANNQDKPNNPAVLQKLQQLQNILKSKETSIVELTEYLEEQFNKSATLQEQTLAQQEQINTQQELVTSQQQQIANQQEQIIRLEEELKTQSSSIDMSEQLRQKEEYYQTLSSQMEIRLKEKKELLSEMELLVEQKHMEVEEIKTQLKQKQAEKQQDEEQIEEKENLLNEFSDKIYQMEERMSFLENSLAHLTRQNEHIQKDNQQLQQQISEKQSHIAELEHKIIDHEQTILSIAEIEANYQRKLQQLEQERIQAQTPMQLPANPNEVEALLAEKEEEMNGLMEVMDSLQEEIRTKAEIIEFLEEQVNKIKPDQQQSAITSSDNQVQLRLEEKQHECDQKAATLKKLQEEVANLQQALADLHRRLEQQQAHIELQQQYDIVEMEKKIVQQTQELTKSYKLELEDIRKDQPQDVNNDEDDNEVSPCCHTNHEEEERLTVAQQLQQMLVYNEEGENLDAIRTLISKMRSQHREETARLEQENSELKDTLNNLLDINNNLQDELQRIKILLEEHVADLTDREDTIQQKDALIEELLSKNKEMEEHHSVELQELRTSIAAFQESPISLDQPRPAPAPAPKRDSITPLQEHIQQLEEELNHLREQNKQKDDEIIRLRPKDSNFVRELNDLLGDSCTNNAEDEKEQLDRVTAERDQVLIRCQQYQQQIRNMEKQCLQLATSLENLQQQSLNKQEFIESAVHQDNMHSADMTGAKMLIELESKNHIDPPEEEAHHDSQYYEHPSHQQPSHEHEEYQQNGSRIRVEEELQASLGEKNEIICELESSILQIEKGYNAQIMGLRRNNAELNNEIITLRRHLYEANPNAIDIQQFIKDTFAQTHKDTRPFHHDFPTNYSHHYLPSPQPNTSYYSELPLPPPRNHRHPYFLQELNMGEKFMGRPCRQASPFNSTLLAHEPVKMDHSTWQDRRRH